MVTGELNFNATKCKVIHFGRVTHSYGDYYLNGVLLDTIDYYNLRLGHLI